MANTKTLLGFLAGAAVGALAGILLAPDKGSETRKMISKKTGDLGDSLKGSFNDFVDGIKDSYSNLKSDAEDVEEKGKIRLNSMKHDAKNALS
ncbi:MAG TPA: YtxH domain-containing protein [Chitinophagaceae bacterium]|jgi:gas vesicle protein|nr:YtxH domain-containing protein [Chitinophagaceae bacterium]